MLKRLLHLVATEGAADVTALADALGVNPWQVQQMLADLERHGYLEEIAAGCSQPCQRCPLRAACLDRNRLRVWTLTCKGARFVDGDGPPHPAARS